MIAIGSYLGTLYCGGTGYYLSPISFLKDPNVWLKAVSKYRGSHTQVCSDVCHLVDVVPFFHVFVVAALDNIYFWGYGAKLYSYAKMLVIGHSLY